MAGGIVAGMTADFSVVNAALTRAGIEPITSFEDSGDVGRVMGANYYAVIDAELGYPWLFTRRTRQPNRIVGETFPPWSFTWELPEDCRIVRRCTLSSDYEDSPKVPFEINGRKILCNEEEDLWVHYTTTAVDASEWTPTFRELVIMRLHAIALMGIPHEYGAAASIMKQVMEYRREVRPQDAAQQPGKKVYKGRLLRRRYG